MRVVIGSGVNRNVFEVPADRDGRKEFARELKRVIFRK